LRTDIQRVRAEEELVRITESGMCNTGKTANQTCGHGEVRPHPHCDPHPDPHRDPHRYPHPDPHADPDPHPHPHRKHNPNPRPHLDPNSP